MEKELNGKDFSDKEYREAIINNLINFSKEENILDDTCRSISKNLKDISRDKKESLLETFSRESRLLNSTNSYLSNPIKGMRLISDIIQPKSVSKSELDELFSEFDNFIKNDFLNFSKKVAIPNEAEIYKNLLSLRDELLENIKFSQLVSKNHIGVGGSFSAGKSSFINSILNRDIDDDILPIDSRPNTSIPTYYYRG